MIPDPIRAPTSGGLRNAARALREPWRLLAALPSLFDGPHGPSRLVVTVPGFTADDRSMAPLPTSLRRIGHRAAGRGLGTNDGEGGRLWPRLVDRVATLANSEGATVDVVG